MVYKAVSTWSTPTDIVEFEKYYNDVHVPFAARVPGALRLVLTRTSDGFETTPSAFYRVAEMHFGSRADFEKATTTQEWADMRQDAGWVHERFGVSLESGLGLQVDAVLDPSGPLPSIESRGKPE